MLKRPNLVMYRRIIKDQRGAILIEYALMAVLIAVVCVAAVTALGISVQGLFNVAF
jgi:Flp pilus assembly pilin Flp